jgi:hypothetical protein
MTVGRTRAGAACSGVARSILACAAFTAFAAGGARAESAAPIVVASEGGPRPGRGSYPLVFLFQGDAVVESVPSGAGPPTADDPAGGSHLRVRRLRVGEDVAHGRFRARVILEGQSRDETFAPVDGGRIPGTNFLRLTEAFGAFRPHRAFELDVGAQRVPYSLSRQVDELDLRMPERAQPVVALAPDYRTGAAVTSDLGLLFLRVAGMSADRSFDGDLFSSGWFVAARLASEPVGPVGVAPWRRPTTDPWYGWWRFSGGVSVLYGSLLAPRTLALGGDAQFQWRRVTVTGEYLGQHLPDGAGWVYQGAVFEPGVYLIEERLELVARGSWYRQPAPPTPLSPPSDTDTLAAGGALTFFARGGHVRVQAGFEVRHTLEDRLPNAGWGIIRLSLAL